MDTPEAINLANIFMHKFETCLLHDYHEKYGTGPLFWVRFIHEVFFILPGDDKSIKDFVSFCNSYYDSKNKKSSIKFTYEYSKSGVVFLDTKVTFTNDGIITVFKTNIVPFVPTRKVRSSTSHNMIWPYVAIPGDLLHIMSDTTSGKDGWVFGG